MRRLVFSLLILIAAASPALAQRGHDRDDRTLDRILPEVRRNNPGTLLDAEGPRAGPDGRARYPLKWMTPDGRIIRLEADARTGRVTNEERGNARRDPPPRREPGDGARRRRN